MTSFLEIAKLSVLFGLLSLNFAYIARTCGE